MRLKIVLYKYNTLVFGKVLEQDEKLRNAGVIYDNNNFIVKSKGCPALEEDTLYIRGDKKEDNQTFSYNCFTEEEAIELCNKIELALEDINEDTDDENDFNAIIQVI